MTIRLLLMFFLIRDELRRFIRKKETLGRELHSTFARREVPHSGPRLHNELQVVGFVLVSLLRSFSSGVNKTMPSWTTGSQ